MLPILHRTGSLDVGVPVPCAILDIPVEMCCGVLAAMNDHGLPATPMGTDGERMFFFVRAVLDESVGFALAASFHEMANWRSLAALADGRDLADGITWLLPPSNDGHDLPDAAAVLRGLQAVAGGPVYGPAPALERRPQDLGRGLRR